MNPCCEEKTLITDIPRNNFEVLREIMDKLNQILNSKREIMYSDIINLIIREGNLGKSYKIALPASTTHVSTSFSGSRNQVNRSCPALFSELHSR